MYITSLLCGLDFFSVGHYALDEIPFNEHAIVLSDILHSKAFIY
jgi:hypothetical protein